MASTTFSGQSHFRLLDLPAELRLRVYKYAVGHCTVDLSMSECSRVKILIIDQAEGRGQWTTAPLSNPPGPWEEASDPWMGRNQHLRGTPPLLLTNRQVYAEALPVLDASITYHVHINDAMILNEKSRAEPLTARMRNVVLHLSLFEVDLYFPWVKASVDGTTDYLGVWFESLFTHLNNHAPRDLKLELSCGMVPSPRVTDSEARTMCQALWYPLGYERPFNPALLNPVFEAWETLRLQTVVQFAMRPDPGDLMSTEFVRDVLLRYPTYLKDFGGTFCISRTTFFSRLDDFVLTLFLVAENARLTEIGESKVPAWRLWYHERGLDLPMLNDTERSHRKEVVCHKQFIEDFEEEYGVKPDWFLGEGLNADLVKKEVP